MPNHRLTFAAFAFIAAPVFADTITGGLHGSGKSIDNDISGLSPTGDSTHDEATATKSSSGSVITGGLNGDACPNNQVNFSNGGDQSYCCPGAVYGEQDNPFCCVGADFEVPRPTFASCFPSCSGSTEDSGISSTTSQACSTTIYMSESDYSSLAQAAATSLSAERSNGSGGSSSATGTDDSVSSGGSAPSSTTDGNSEQSAASGSAASSTDSEGVATALMTSGPMVGALVAAGVLIQGL
ncbi:hypothetical protein Q7P37_008256 [Cladosporium fusiforme]